MSNRIVHMLLALSLAAPVGYAQAHETEKKKEEAGQAAEQAAKKDEQLEHALKRLSESDGYSSDDEELWEPTYQMAMREREEKQYAGRAALPKEEKDEK